MAQSFTVDELQTAATARFVERRIVRFQDVDAAGIIFYPRVLEYFSDAYIGMLLGSGFDLPKALTSSSMGTPLVHAEADYLAPLRFGDAIDVEVVGVKMGETSFAVGYRVRMAGGRVAASGQTVHVCLDRGTFKPMRISAELRGIFEAVAAG